MPALHIVGSGGTREEAEAHAIDAVRYVLEGVEGDFDKDEGVQVGYLDVDIRSAHEPTDRPARAMA